MSKWITLRLEVAEGATEEDVITYFNCEALCPAEEEDNIITSWEWSELVELEDNNA